MQLYMTGIKKASATANISVVQIPLHQKKHLRQRISQSCRCRNIKKNICNSEYPSIVDTTTHHKNNKRLCNLANWSRACPTKLSKRAQSLGIQCRGSVFAKPHHLSNTLLICSTGKFKSPASLSTSVIDLEQAVEAVLRSS